MAKLDPKPFDGLPQKKDGEDYTEFYHRQYESFQKMWDAGLDLPEGQIKGAVVHFPIADGHANYIVTKLRPLTLQHVPVDDGWQIPLAHIRGLRKDDLVHMVNMQRGMRDIFAKR